MNTLTYLYTSSKTVLYSRSCVRTYKKKVWFNSNNDKALFRSFECQKLGEKIKFVHTSPGEFCPL